MSGLAGFLKIKPEFEQKLTIDMINNCIFVSQTGNFSINPTGNFWINIYNCFFINIF